MSLAIDIFGSVSQVFEVLSRNWNSNLFFTGKKRPVRSHVFICFMALIFKSMLLKKMRAIDSQVSYLAALRELKRLRAMSIKIHKKTLVVRTEVKDNAKIAFRSLKTAFPKKVLKHENSSKMIVMS